MFERHAGTMLCQQNTVSGGLATTSKVNQIHTHSCEGCNVIGPPNTGCPQQSAREAMLEGDEGTRQFPRLAGELDSIGQHDNFRFEFGVHQALIMIHSLPRNWKQGRCPLFLAGIGVFE